MFHRLVPGRVRLTLCRFHSVTVQAGGHVTLSCANLSNFPSHVSWSKLADGGNIGCISTMASSESRAVLCDEGQGDKYNMTSNGTDIFLDVQEVNLLDAGVYICSLSTDKFKGIFGVTYLQVEGKAEPILIGVISDIVFLVNELVYSDVSRCNFTVSVPDALRTKWFYGTCFVVRPCKKT